MKRSKRFLTFIAAMLMILAVSAVYAKPANAATTKAQALAKYKSAMARNYKSTDYFATAYINNDSVPELIIRCNASYQGKSFVGYRAYTCINGVIKRLHYVDYMDPIRYYYPKTGVIYMSYYWDNDKNSLAREWENLYTTGYAYTYTDYGYTSYGYAGNDYATKAQFSTYLKKLTKGKSAVKVVYHRNTAANRAKYLK